MRSIRQSMSLGKNDDKRHLSGSFSAGVVQLPSVQTREFAPSFVTITASKTPKHCQLVFLTPNFTECSVLAKPLGQN